MLRLRHASRRGSACCWHGHGLQVLLPLEPSHGDGVWLAHNPAKKPSCVAGISPSPVIASGLGHGSFPSGWQGFAAEAATTATPEPAEGSTKAKRKGVTGVGAMQVQRQLNVADLASPEMIAEPYRGRNPRLPLSSWVTPSGWRMRWQRILAEVRGIYALASCTRNVKGFSMKTFKSETLELYQRINELIATGDLTLLKRHATGKCFSLLKKEIKHREKSNWARIVWGLAELPTVKNVELVQARMMALDPNNDKTHFAQLTVRITSKHRFAAYDRKGRLSAGDPDKEVPVEDFWVLERAIMNPEGRWVLAARLSMEA